MKIFEEYLIIFLFFFRNL